MDKGLHSRALGAKQDEDSSYGFTEEWMDMPVARTARDGGCISRAKSQASVYCAEGRKDIVENWTRGREDLRSGKTQHSGRVLKWLRNSLRRSRSRSNSRKNQHEKEAQLEKPNISITPSQVRTEAQNLVPNGKITSERVTKEPVSNVRNKVELFEHKSTRTTTKCSESLQVTRNLDRYSLLKAQQGGNVQVLSAHQAALFGGGQGVVVASAADSAPDVVAGVGNSAENVRSVVAPSSSGPARPAATSDKLAASSATYGGRVSNTALQVPNRQTTDLAGQGDVPGMCTGRRSHPSIHATGQSIHENNTRGNLLVNPGAQTTPTGQQNHPLDTNNTADVGLTPQGNSGYSVAREGSALTSRTDWGLDSEVKGRDECYEPLIERSGPSHSVSQSEVCHNQRGQRHINHNTDLPLERHSDLRVTQDNQNTADLLARGTGRHFQCNGSKGTSEVIEFQQVDTDYASQLKNLGQKYFGSVTGSLCTLNRAARCVSGGLYTEDSPPTRPPLPLESHFCSDRASVCSSSTLLETMVSCKEAVQKATTTVTSRSKSPTKSQGTEEVASKVKAYEQSHRTGSPSASDLSRAGSGSGSSSDVSGSHTKSISRIANVGTHSSYFHASDITVKTTTALVKEKDDDLATLDEKTDRGTESSTWNESGPEGFDTKPLDHSTPSRMSNSDHDPNVKYRGNWDHLMGASSPSLGEESSRENQNHLGVASGSSELCTPPLTETSTLDWNSGHHEDSPSSRNHLSRPRPLGKNVCGNANQTGKESTSSVPLYENCSPISVISERNQKSIFDNETASSENKSCDLLTPSDLMDASMKTKDLNVSSEGREDDKEESSKSRYVKKRSKSQHILCADNIRTKAKHRAHQRHQNMWRSQSQPNVSQDGQALQQKRLGNQLGRVASDSSLSSDSSSSSSLDGGHLGDVVEARLRGRTRRKYRVNGRSGKSRSQGHLAGSGSRSHSRSLSRSLSRDRSLDGIIRPEQNFILEKWWATLGDIPATMDGAHHNKNRHTQIKTVKDRSKTAAHNGKIASLSVIVQSAITVGGDSYSVKVFDT